MKFDEWVRKYLGRKTDFDGAYGVQCVDLIDCYINDVLELKIGFWGNAKDWWIDRNYSKWLKDNFLFVTPKYYDGELKTGDIGIRTSGTYGHIFIVKGPAQNGKFSYYDQNATGNGDAMTLRTKPFTSAYVNGILRPKNRINLKEESTVSEYGNARMKSGERTYADSDLTMRVGYVDKNERVYYLGTGEGNPIITYQTSTGYKVGFVRRNSVNRD